MMKKKERKTFHIENNSLEIELHKFSLFYCVTISQFIEIRSDRCS